MCPSDHRCSEQQWSKKTILLFVWCRVGKKRVCPWPYSGRSDVMSAATIYNLKKEHVTYKEQKDSRMYIIWTCMFGVWQRERKRGSEREKESITYLCVFQQAPVSVRVCCGECEDSITLLSLISSSFKAIAGDVKQMRGHEVTQYLFSITFERL